MHTRQLSVTVRAHEDGLWFVALIKTTYSRGRVVSTDVETGTWTTEDQVLELAQATVSQMTRLERERVESEAARYRQSLSAALAETDPG